MTKAQSRTTSKPKRPTPPAGSGSRAGTSSKPKPNGQIEAERLSDWWLGLFESADARRKNQEGGLSYTKSQVTTHFLSNEAEQRFAERLRILKAHPLRHLLRSVFEDLKNWTAAKHRSQRGWLVDAQGRPASYEYLAAQLQVSVADLKKAMRVLRQIGLIERGLFDGSPDGDGRNRTQPDAAGRKRLALNKNNGKNKNNGNGKNKNNGKSKNKNKPKDKHKATSGLAASGSKHKNNGKTTASVRKNNGDGKDDSQSKASEQGQEESQAQKQSGTTPPATAPEPLPSQPQESDGQGDRATLTLSPLPSLSQGQSRSGLTYGRRVYVSLGYRHDVDSTEARREITSFASKHDEIVSALTGLSPPAVDAVLQRGLAEAVKIGKRRNNRNKGAVWNCLMGKLAAAAQPRSPPG